MAEVRFSIAYSASESVATAWTVAWCGIIRGLVDVPPPLKVFAVVVVVVLAAEERVDEARESVRAETGIALGWADGRVTPVRA